jgi:hypothetical protein
MNWAIIVLIILSAMGLGMSFAKHGEQQKPYNGWISLFTVIVNWTLLYYAGLFDKC